MKKTVLVVDDEEDIRESVRQVVESNGYKAKVAGSGKEALELLKKEKFDLVLMDLFMPEMSGRDCVRAIRDDQKLKGQKVAFLTVAHLSEAGESIIKDLAPADYIRKPISVEDLTNKLKKLLS